MIHAIQRASSAIALGLFRAGGTSLRLARASESIVLLTPAVECADAIVVV